MSAPRRVWSLPYLLGSLLLVLVLLAWLQSRWIDALAEGEAARLGNFVSSGSQRLASELSE